VASRGMGRAVVVVRTKLEVGVRGVVVGRRKESLSGVAMYDNAPRAP